MGPGVVDITPRNELSQKFIIRKVVVVAIYIGTVVSRFHLGYIGG